MLTEVAFFSLSQFQMPYVAIFALWIHSSIIINAIVYSAAPASSGKQSFVNAFGHVKIRCEIVIKFT